MFFGQPDMHQKVFFQVHIVYNTEAEDVPDDIQAMDSIPFADVDEAERIAEKLAGKIHKKFPKSCLVHNDVEDDFDGFHLIIMDHETGIHIAKVGISFENYTNETIH